MKHQATSSPTTSSSTQQRVFATPTTTTMAAHNTNVLMMSMLVSLLLLVTSLGVDVVDMAGAQSCARIYRLQFKDPSIPGSPSYITQPNQPVTVAALTAIPPVIVYVEYYDNRTGTWQLDLTLENTVQAKILPARLITGDTALLSAGEAYFSVLTIGEAPAAGQTYRFEFVVSIANVPTQTELTLSTGSILFRPTIDSNVLSSLRFRNRGFFYRAGQEREIPAGAPLPTFYVETLNPFGNSVASTVQITLTASDGTVTPSSFTGTEIVPLLGVTFIPSNPTITETTLYISGTDGTTTVSVATGLLTVSTTRIRNRFLMFDNTGTSYITEENMGNTAVLNLAMPTITVLVASSALTADASNSGLIIRATSSQGTLVGSEAVVERGKADFKKLMFINNAPSSAVITFTAGPQGSLPVSGFSLVSGSMSVAVTPVKAKYLSFAQASFVQDITPKTVQMDSSRSFVIPSIIVLLKDSAFQIDSSASDITLVLFIEPAGLINTDQGTATIINGIAAFTDVAFTDGTVGLTFTISVTDPTGSRDPIRSAVITLADSTSTTTAQRQLQLSSYCITVNPTTACEYSLVFGESPLSLISVEGQSFFTTVGAFIPEIRIILHDRFGAVDSIDSSVVPTVIAYTGDDPNSESLLVSGSNIGYWRDQYYVFTCLQFSESPAGLVTLKFAPVVPTDTSTLYAGINTLETGFVTVAASTTSSFGLRFAQSDSLFVHAGQTTSAVVNIALPTIVVEVVDSVYQYDSEAGGGMVISVETSTGTLDTDGSRELVVGGQATFSTLKFTTIADSPILTFRAQQSTTDANGKTISTGAISLTTLPVSTSEINFIESTNTFNDVTRQFQTFSFNTITSATILASVTIRDSAHQTESPPAGTIEIDVQCDEANLQTGVPGSITPLTSSVANFSTVFTSYRRNYEGAPIYLKYVVTSSSNPLLINTYLTVGPITIRSTEETGTCVRRIVSPRVVAKFKSSVEAFLAIEDTMRASLSYLVGIDTSRLLINTVERAVGVDYETVTSWVGSKVTIEFLDPSESSANQRSPQELAAVFVTLRPSCMDPINGLTLESVYYAADEQSCDAASYYSALNLSQTCAAIGINPTCQCYDENLVEPLGSLCAVDDSGFKESFVELCNGPLIDCKEATILAVCLDVIDVSNSTYYWIFGIVAGIIIIGIGVFILYKKGIIFKKPTTTLHSEQ